MVTALLAYPGVDVNATDVHGRTARAIAKARGHVRIALLLRRVALTTKLRDTLTAFRRALRQRSRRRELGGDVSLFMSMFMNHWSAHIKPYEIYRSVGAHEIYRF